MIALDTNVLVRLITRDHEEQTNSARELVSLNICLVPDSVLLEAAWVLRSSYAANRKQIQEELARVLGLPNIRTENDRKVRRAMQWFSEGLEFADAFHLAASQEATAFLTFDRRFEQRAVGKGTCPVLGPDGGH